MSNKQWWASNYPRASYYPRRPSKSWNIILIGHGSLISKLLSSLDTAATRFCNSFWNAESRNLLEWNWPKSQLDATFLAFQRPRHQVHNTSSLNSEQPETAKLELQRNFDGSQGRSFFWRASKKCLFYSTTRLKILHTGSKNIPFWVMHLKHVKDSKGLHVAPFCSHVGLQDLCCF